MKKRFALLLVFCLLFTWTGAQALTTEQVLLSALPEAIAKLPDGFRASLETGSGTLNASLGQDEQGSPLLLWGISETGESYALPLQTLVQALMQALTGMEACPEVSPEDEQLLTDAADALAEAIMRAVTVTHTAPTEQQPAHQTDVTIALHTLLLEVDAAVTELLSTRAADVDALLGRCTPAAEALFPDALPLPDAAALLAAWQEADVGSLIPVDIHLKVKILAHGDFSDPWEISARMLGLQAQAVWKDGHFSAVLDTGAVQYCIDTRDFETAADILLASLNHITPHSLHAETSANAFSAHVNPALLASEIKNGLLDSLHLNRDTVRTLLVKYAPWFGMEDRDAAELEESLFAWIEFQWRRISRVSIPEMDVQAQLADELFTLNISAGALQADVRATPQTLECTLLASGHEYRLTGLLGDEDFSLHGRLDSETFTLSARLEDENILMDLYNDGSHLLTGVITENAARFTAVPSGQELLVIFTDESLHLSTSDGSVDALLFVQDQMISWNVRLPALRCSGQLTADENSCTLNLHCDKLGNYYRSDVQNELNMKLTRDSLYLAYETGLSSRSASRRWCAEIRLPESGAELHLDQIDQYAQKVFSMDYRPGWFALTDNNRSLIIASESAPGGVANRTRVTLTDRYGVHSWTLDSRFSSTGCLLTLTGDHEMTLKVDYGMAQLTSEELQEARVLTVQDLLEDWGLVAEESVEVP